VSATISVHGLVKVYRSRRRRLRALDGVDLEVGPGEVFGLLGPNGAGKTTLVKIVLGLTRPTGGAVRIRGANPDHASARLRVGYLPEGHRFPGYLSGVAALRLFGRLAGVTEGVLDSRIPELLDLVGLADRGCDRIGRYSKGMTQRLGLAAALIDRPEVLLLDEPTDGVDPVGRRHIRDVLLAERERGTSILVNSHLLSEVERTCGRVAILDRGRVVREAAIDELTRGGLRFRVRAEGGVVEPATPVPGVGLTRCNGYLDVEAESLDALNALLDALRRDGRLLTEVTPLGSDLEDVFVKLVGGGQPPTPRAAGGGAQ
jgi:ABC-2 type transport system ATP-binding protein